MKFFGVTWLERPKGVKSGRPDGPKAGPGPGSGGVRGLGRGSEVGGQVGPVVWSRGAWWVPRLLAYHHHPYVFPNSCRCCIMYGIGINNLAPRSTLGNSHVGQNSLPQNHHNHRFNQRHPWLGNWVCCRCFFIYNYDSAFGKGWESYKSSSSCEEELTLALSCAYF